jgi:arsenate reductase
MKKVLFICIHNSARSQMAEEYLRMIGGDSFEVESCGFEPTTINPLVVKVMAEEGIDLSNKKTQSISNLIKEQKFYGYIITVCNRAKVEECPTFPGVAKRMHWNLEDPEHFTGSEEVKLDKVRALRDQIKGLVRDFVKKEAGNLH